MRYGHGAGGLTGITLNQSALSRWALSHHIYSQLLQGLTKMQNDSITNSVTSHKEESTTRIQSVAEDRNGLHDKLELSIDPLKPESHQTR